MKIFGYEIKKLATEKVEVPEVMLEKRRMKISESMRERLNAMGPSAADSVLTSFPIVPYTPPKNVAPAQHVIAMDASIDYSTMGVLYSGGGFPGFTYLTELAQLTEYRDMSERVASEMTRKWIKLRSKADTDRSKEIDLIEAEMRRLRLRELFRRAAEVDGFMGRSQLFIDLGDDNGPELAKPLVISKLKVSTGRLRGLKLVEPINTYPNTYNSNNPLAPDYYNPSTWYVQGRPVHSSRLLTFISRPLPDLLKPAYNFSGMSLSQLAQPYVENWMDTRDSVAKLLKNFSTSILKTNMQDVLEGGTGDTLMARARMFTKFRDNQGLFLLDSETEDFTQVNTPIGGLSQLQAQAQEHMAAVAKTPLVILLGISPTGLNASSEGEIRVFYDYVSDQQEKLFRPNLEVLLKIIQLNLFGEIYEDITFEFVSLFAMSATEQATIRSSDATAGAALITAGVLHPIEERARLAKNPESGYDSITITDVPEPPAPPPMMGAETKPTDKKAPKAGGKDAAIGHDASFFGNQHTGVIAASDDTPYAIAVKSSAVASNATSVATHTPTKRNNERAMEAHQRALEAHEAALGVDGATLSTVHEAYIETHKNYITQHSTIVQTLQDRIDSWASTTEV